MRGFLHHAQHDAVQHFDRGRSDGARRDLGHRVGAIVHGVVDREQRLHQLRLAHQAHGDLGDQHHGAFRARQQAGEIVAGRIQRLAADGHRRSVGQNGFEAQHVIGGDAVGQRVRPARVLRHIAADGAGLLAGGIGRVEISVALHRLRDFQIHHARLQHRALVREIDLDNAIHARERDHDAARARDHAAAQSGARAAADNRDAVLAGDPNQRRYLVRQSAGKTTSSGRALSTLPSYS